MGIEGLSLFFVIMTIFMISICISMGWSGMIFFGKEYIIAFQIHEFLMISCPACWILYYYMFFPEA
ncbi:hypothetical protein ZWY2020_040499 [Hordeum vulgare]|nr:hypothetical protein ZWY2020_040499 [Hordeum vulgare]